MYTQTHRLKIAIGLVALGATTCALADPPQGHEQKVEVGAGYVSEDSAKFGRYNGLDEKGPYAVGDVDLLHRYDGGYYSQMRGTHLGLDSRYLRLEGGQQGRITGYLDFNQLNVHNSDSAVTPFRGDGSDRLRLPNNWTRGNSTADMPQLDGSLRPVDIETERKRTGVGASFIPGKHWNFDINYHHETKDGTGRIGGATSFLAGSSVLPEPVDYTTDDLEAIAGYSRGKGQFELTYRMSLFNDKNDSLTWDNPYTAGADTGRLATPPDNRFHQLSLSGGYQLPMNSRLTGLLSMGMMRQDEGFVPFTSNPALARPLPRNDLDGKVYIKTGRIQLHSRPLPKWDYTFSYRFYDRDNKTPTNNYDYVTADVFPGGVRESSSYNYKQQQVDTRVAYKLGSRTRLSLGYKYDDNQRSPSEVDRTRDHTLDVALRTRIRNDLTASLYLSGSRRDGTTYRQLSRTTNPGLRVSYLADRDQKKAGLSLSYNPTERLSLVGSADYVHDDYDDTEIGLQDTTHPTYNLDASYVPVEDITLHAFYTYDNNRASQWGSQSGDQRDWRATTDDSNDTFGVGVVWNNLFNRLDAGADYVYSKSTGRSDVGGHGDYPDLTNRLNSVRLFGQYHLRDNTDLRLTYRYENFHSQDWAVDGVGPATIDQVLSLGGNSPDYNVSVVSLSLVAHWY